MKEGSNSVHKSGHIKQVSCNNIGIYVHIFLDNKIKIELKILN